MQMRKITRWFGPLVFVGLWVIATLTSVQGQSSWGREAIQLGHTLPALPAELLVFSDHPERVTRLGMLCQGGLLPLRPVRWQFYHQGGLDSPLYLVLRLRNRGQAPALVTTIGGVGIGTEDDYFQAGHQNNVEFLERWVKGQGQKIELAAGEEITVWHQLLPRDIVVSGTVEWCLWQGQQVEYALYACSAPEGPFAANLLFEEKDVHARGIYPEPFRQRRSSFDVATWKSEKDNALWAIGATRQPSAVSGPDLKGDYGVVYRWDLKLKNSSPAPRQMEFALNPRGGKATGTFMVQRQGAWELWEQPHELEAFQFQRLATCTLAPHSEEQLTIYTIPEGASNYPVRLVVRPIIDLRLPNSGVGDKR